MVSITVDGITYTLTIHASERIAFWRLTLAQVEQTMSDPDHIEASHSSGRTLYLKTFQRPKGTVIVAVEEENATIVTVYMKQRPR
jgi:hypothetical protein